MLAQVALVFWFWTAPLLGVLAGWPGLGLVVLTDLIIGWRVGLSPLHLCLMAFLGLGALLGSFWWGRRCGIGSKAVAAAALGLTLGIAFKPVFGLVGGSLLPALVLLGRSPRALLLALVGPCLRLVASLSLGLWLLFASW